MSDLSCCLLPDKIAEGATTCLALVIIEDALIDDFAEFGASDASCRTAYQTTENGSGDTAKRHTDWTSNNANRATKFSTA
ncbi:MAG: hypothetical protein VB032_01765 [Burkholderiaceae bacterium]|nr:hypothetical protein [Burkholderiaceae bacterium]